jgi:hypothetical protein
MNYGYRPMPQNPQRQINVNDVISSPLFAPAVMAAVNNPSLRSSLVGKSVPWGAVDLPLVTALPQNPDDRAEVNYLIDSTNEVVVRMVYRKATGNWVQVGKPPVVTTLPTGVDGMEVYYEIDTVNGIYLKMLYTGGAWTEVHKIPILTALPTAAYTGYEIIYDTGTAGVRWHLVYDASDGATYPWLYIGGPPLTAEAQSGGTFESTATTANYAALATAGPSITLPRAGDYDVAIGCRAYNDTNGDSGAMSYDIGGTAASDNDAILFSETAGTNTSPANYYRMRRKTGLTAVTLTSKYKAIVGGNATFTARSISATPVRVA